MILRVFVLTIVAFTYAFDNNPGDLSESDTGITFPNITKHVQNEFLNILNGTVSKESVSGCFGFEPDYEKVEFLLYTNKTNSYTLLDPTDPIGIDNDEPLYIISHGYLSGLNGYKMKELRDMYIKLYGKNILYVNWGKIAWLAYTTCACNIPFIGLHLAKFLCILSEKQDYNLSKVHMIGHSLGGQLAGQAGKGTQRLCNKKIGRITALDPAGPMFQYAKEAGRLVPTDAEFVEAVHSNAGLFGFVGKVGTVDYHLNCGSAQPGCIIPKDITKLAETAFAMFICAHLRSVEIWPYVLETKQFIAKSCQICARGMPFSCFSDTFGANYISLGHTYTKPNSENYNLITGSFAPFHLGCSAYPFQGCTEPY